MIPHRLVRTVPAVTTDETEKLWDIATKLHPDWEHVTLRDPVDRLLFPLTSPYWDQCESGAQLADLIRAEDLLHRGGWYIDSDIWMLRPLDSLCPLNAVAAWEDHLYIPNAVLGFTAGHDALRKVIDLAIARRTRGTWQAGVGVTTEVFRNHPDLTLLPPGTFYPVHWREAHRRLVDWVAEAQKAPWAFAIHKYAASWHK
jgi:hypothetical protein